MLYLSGCKTAAISAELANGTVGFLNTPSTRRLLHDCQVWAMDNGAFTDTYPGDDDYLRILEGYRGDQERCLFVAAPDVLGDAPATLELFPKMAARLKADGWPVALVGQDGMENLPVPWHETDWLFVGGSTEWKLGVGAELLIRQAQTHGVRVHVGRVNSGTRFRHFDALGCDTADGTYLAFGPEKNAPKLFGWMNTPRQEFLA